MERFALNGRSAIEQSPLQTYRSALIFAPDKSLVRKQFEDKIPKWMKRLPKLSLQRLERIITDARGPYLLGHVGGILTRRRAAGIDFTRQDDAAVGCSDGRREAHARGPYQQGHVGGILTRRRAAGIGFGRQDGAGVGRGDGRREAHARGPYLLRQFGGILTRRRAAGIGFRRQHGAAVGRGDGRRAPDDRACLLRQRLILHSRWIFHTDESRASAPRRPARPLSARRLCTSASHISRRELDPTELGKASLAPC